jgi:hypothetical protein
MDANNDFFVPPHSTVIHFDWCAPLRPADFQPKPDKIEYGIDVHYFNEEGLPTNVPLTFTIPASLVHTSPGYKAARTRCKSKLIDSGATLFD